MIRFKARTQRTGGIDIMTNFDLGFRNYLLKLSRLPLPLGFGKVRAKPIKGILTSKFTKTPTKLRLTPVSPMPKRTFGV